MQNPKRHITKLALKGGYFGNRQRIENAKEAFEDNTVFPKPVEYEDIDRAVLEFVRDKIVLIAEDKLAPTFTLFSNHRFSEYSQTWEHVDNEGNLLMDFKTVNREPNPKWGENQGGLYNIPGDRRYTVQMKEILDDNGTESYEVYSMPQPLSIDIEYTLNYVTGDWNKLNDFNVQLNNLFKAIQCYIKPNGWYMPMKLDSIGDETEYAVDNRKIYIQSASITVKGIVVPKSEYKIEKFPKRKFIGVNLEPERLKAHVDVEENDGGSVAEITINFPTGVDRTEFLFDDTVIVKEVKTDNIRDFTLFIDEERIRFPKNGFSLTDGNNIKFKINPVDKAFPSKIVLVPII